MSDWTNLLLLIIEAALYFAVMAGLFRLRHRFGIGLVFCALGTMHFLETYLAAILYLQLPGAIVISPGSVVLFAGKLVMLLLVYIREDAAAVRQPIYGLLVGNLLMVALVFTMRFHEFAIPVVDRAPDFRFMDEMGGLMIWGTILLFLDSILIILVYELTGEWFGQRQAPRLILSAAVVLTFDQLGFFTALFLLVGVPVDVLFSGWVAKMGASLVFGLMAAFYLRYVETTRTVRGTPRLLDVFDTLTYRRNYEEALDTAGRDELTGLLDRGRFDGEGRSLVNDAIMGKRSLSLMVIDIDNFSEFNDRHGREAGDEVLRQVAARVRQATRETDRIYRYGREEIVVLCDGLAHRPAFLAAERLKRRIAIGLNGGAGPITASIGLATAPVDGMDLASLLEVADRRLSEAKSAGGDRVVGRPGDEGGGNVAHLQRREQA
ncbi:MAG TPA: GGDEF domain-containing protein [Bauldia sp.]|nr:GGDEF domain-containing protein [Bauldia sp.]